MREVIKTGRTVEDATELALAELGVSAEEAGIEVLELPQRRLFKSIPAKVRAYVEDEEVPEAPARQGLLRRPSTWSRTLRPAKRWRI